VYLLLYLIQVVIFFVLPHVRDLTLFTAAFALIGLCYGGGFGTMPSFTADFFGAKYMGGIYGWILLAWGMAAIPSPIMIAHVRQNTGSYGPAITVIAIVMLVSLVLPLITRRPSREQTAVPAVAAGSD
jgi:OFA family oxalate/formate antiporter-like MFS transporter